jgi:hypothetical protein
MGFEDEVEQSIGRPCRQSDGRFKRTYELTSSIVLRGTSFHHLVELEFPPIGFDHSLLLCRCGFPGPAELGAVNPDAVHDHGQPSSPEFAFSRHFATLVCYFAINLDQQVNRDQMPGPLGSLANKLARIVLNVLVQGRNYETRIRPVAA